MIYRQFGKNSNRGKVSACALNGASIAAAALMLLAGTASALAQGQPVREGEKVGTSAVPAGNTNATPAGELDNRWYPVSKFEVSYAGSDAGLPPIGEVLASTNVELTRTETGFTRAKTGMATVTLNLAGMSGDAANYDRLAIADVTRALANELRNRGLLAVLVGPTVDEVDESGADLRKGRTTFKIEIVVGRVGEIRTLANGERFNENRINNPAHEAIKENSPIRPGDVLGRGPLDGYTFRLNRHPGRRVDVSVAPGSEQVGDITLDYLVSENRPWYVLGQLSNTGTENTDKWRERFAFVHNQLTNQDDILRVDYVTAGFAQAHSLVGSYEFPLFIPELRLNLFGAYNKFTASDVGLAGETFKGNSWRAGAELTGNIFQHGQLFIDVVGGARWDHMEVRNTTANISGATDYFIPYAGLKLERRSDTASIDGRVMFEWTSSEIANTKLSEVQNLGRLDPDLNYTLLKWDFGASFYLEPLLFPGLYNGSVRPVDADGNPAAWQPGMTLAHELSFTTRGQNSFNRRLVANVEEVAGGFFSVRGYPESAIAGDNTFIASAEYRLHIPRLFGISSSTSNDPFGKPFRWAPQEPYGMADWDLIFRGFFDVGRVVQNNIKVFETNATLMGAGVGLELQLRRNVYIRGDLGVALRALPRANVKSGDARLHFMLTLLF